MKYKILFVCLGNICRSPAAEGILKYYAERDGLYNRIFVDSAGLGDWHVGQLPDKRMREHGERHGYTFDSRARKITLKDFDDFDRIIGMDKDNFYDLACMIGENERLDKLSFMGDYITNHPRYDEVPDPYYGTDSDFELVIDLLEDGCANIYSMVKKELGL